jgi:starvation-inducible DNA-binding protein
MGGKEGSLRLRTKNFLWDMNERDFCDYHLLLDEHAEQIVGVTGDVGERANKIGGTTRCSIGEISEQQRLKDKNEEPVAVE